MNASAIANKKKAQKQLEKCKSILYSKRKSHSKREEENLEKSKEEEENIHSAAVYVPYQSSSMCI